MLATDDHPDVALPTIRELRSLTVQLAESGVPIINDTTGPLLPAADVAAWYDHGLIVRADASFADKLWVLRTVAYYLRRGDHSVRHLRLVPGGS